MPVVRHGERRGGAAGERGLTSGPAGEPGLPPGPASSSGLPPGPALSALVRPALELAWAVARAGEQLRPPVAAPRPVRPLLGFARLPARALDVVRRVVDEDESFRARVTDAAEAVELSRPARLFLERPEGWTGELEELLAAARAEIDDRQGAQHERDARRRIKAAEESARRAEETLAREREHTLRTADELRSERRSRRAAEEEAAAARRRVDALLVERAEARRALEEARAELARLRDAVRQGVELERVARDIEEAAEAATELASRLHSAGAAISPGITGAPGGAPAGTPADAPADAPAPEAGSGPPTVPPGARRSRLPRPPAGRGGPRRPAPLPPGVRDDSPEAAEHLVRTPGAVLVVDGYNASLAWRPTLPIAEQRRRLVDALEELAARTKSEVQVVFDGVETAPPIAATGSRRLVRARFSPADVEADDIVVGLVEELPPHRPVVVASNDRDVQERAERRGANVVSVSQLMAVLRRER